MSGARSITLFLGGHWYGRYGVAACPLCQPERRRDQRALSIADGAERLLVRCFKSDCAFRDVLAATGLALCGFARPDPFDLARQKAEAIKDEARRRAQALRCWAETQPAAGTLAERYLRARGYRGTIPSTLRFQADCWHKSARRFPTMVGVVERAGELVGVHRTFLVEPGAKANVDPVKAMLGPMGGGALRLSDGPGPLVAAEGIETTLAVMDALWQVSPRAWSSLSAPGMKALQLPANPGELVIAPDSGAPGMGAADALARRAWGLGWSVRIMEPPEVGDWADVALGDLGALGGLTA